ncbi:cytochrome c biogenesis protein CcsA [Algivirga pacifica]|uniref:Heme exporter protein C n=1 Tax=Algivirga pacifica TaxID=1162670 RepID=A0ABP9DQW3_9BACT
MKLSWWKIVTIVLLTYTVIGGLLMEVPRLPILNETIRNLYFHVPMWFSMIIQMLVGTVYAIKYLKSSNTEHDLKSVEFTNAGILFGILGLLTGMLWAKFTWGDFWTGDPKLNATAVGMMFYMGYFVLRNSLQDAEQKARISGIYNIFIFPLFVALIFVLPRLTDSLHPGNGGNPGFNAYDLDSKLRLVFYPAVIGWILLGVWIATLKVRLRKAEDKILEKQEDSQRAIL